MAERLGGGDPRPGQRTVITDDDGNVVGYGTWQERQYQTPEGSIKTYLTVVPDPPRDRVERPWQRPAWYPENFRDENGDHWTDH